MYHRISGIQTRGLYHGYIDARIVISEKKFSYQIEKIMDDYSIISLESLVGGLNYVHTLPDNPCVITFDDGFHEMYDIVFPILKKFNITATFFISGDHIAGTNRVRWLDLYYHLLDQISESDINNNPAIKNIHPNLRNSNDVRATLKQVLRELPLEKKYQLLSGLEKILGLQVDIQSLNELLYLSPSHIVEMTKAGMSFGAHGMAHQSMADMDPKIVMYEVRESIQKIRKLTGQKHVAFAYPFGGINSYTVETVKIVQENGAMCGCTSMPKMNTPETSLFGLNRIPAETFSF